MSHFGSVLSVRAASRMGSRMSLFGHANLGLSLSLLG
jgi:hypothetical protein